MDVQLDNASENGDESEARGDEIGSLRRELGRARARLEKLEEKLKLQARARTELIHFVCHELRTPITVISGFGRLLLTESQGSLNQEQLHYVDESLKACSRLDQFVVDLLEAQPDSGAPLSVEIVEADLHALIRAHLESLSPLFEDRGIEIELKLAADSSRMPFDERRIDQVMTNLMSNAIRYVRPGGIVRISTQSRQESDRAYVEVSVEDDGPGIAVEDREHLFAPYVRGDEEDDYEGLGIGLAICRRVVSSHGGTIRVDSGELGGARFVFELPCRHSAEGED